MDVKFYLLLILLRIDVPWNKWPRSAKNGFSNEPHSTSPENNVTCPEKAVDHVYQVHVNSGKHMFVHRKVHVNSWLIEWKKSELNFLFYWMKQQNMWFTVHLTFRKVHVLKVTLMLGNFGFKLLSIQLHFVKIQKKKYFL